MSENPDMGDPIILGSSDVGHPPTQSLVVIHGWDTRRLVLSSEEDQAQSHNYQDRQEHGIDGYCRTMLDP
jgi:hypothetical protein